ncbi:MAG: UDP-N-acetylglucosamine acyltransferase [Verrucomicrobiales bacterium]|jgi:UDP-N-acetylglucosamine acyltransferase
MHLHPTAIIDSKAQLGSGVTIGPFAIIEAGVAIGDDCVIAGHAQILGRVELGEGTRIGSGAIIGGLPQDTSFDPEILSGVRIGRRNDLREHVTVHRGTSEGAMTIIGDRNFLMVGSHLGHDCKMGDDNTLANHCLLGGHVQMGNGGFLGGGGGYHQFVRIGDRVMAHGLSAISMDLPPFVMASGRNGIVGLNSVGLQRAGFSPEARAEVKAIYRIFCREGLGKSQAIMKAETRIWGPEATRFLEFVKAESVKGVCLRSL